MERIASTLILTTRNLVVQNINFQLIHESISLGTTKMHTP